ncbi:16S rRNA (uracil(1498)-N(3))-methyltransferase [Deinococcus sp. SL84]|uniref:16S rRNA (uracil(1498)-N(3))-methyltransferase n=1 Tax=Deinococcus sp. SL84 TaxID=2994663 RepID=UPI0022741290|nr:16S rRNA (uracil(1498)-N(3))-methyltransferase [Deinococcus sp. SL84]MCY1703083.1 16S rRNA (uracil(1498)-N(3))-methyltransferase [Deinococcus sp. SL84]
MRLTRVRVPELPADLEAGPELVLTGGEVRHLGVMRLGAGDPLLVFDGRGREARAEVTALDGLRATLRLVEELPGTPETPQPVTLAVALLKGDKLADVVRAATELGVARIQLLVTQHADVRDIGANKLARLNRVAAEASKQSRRAVTPEVLPPVPLAALTWEGQAYVAHPYVHDLLSSHLHWDSPVTLLTGPEGGFSESEMEALLSRGAQGVVLGPRILRAETAPLALLGAIAATGV